jgi:hypothetical protein
MTLEHLTERFPNIPPSELYMLEELTEDELNVIDENTWVVIWRAVDSYASCAIPDGLPSQPRYYGTEDKDEMVMHLENVLRETSALAGELDPMAEEVVDIFFYKQQMLDVGTEAQKYNKETGAESNYKLYIGESG